MTSLFTLLVLFPFLCLFNLSRDSTFFFERWASCVCIHGVFVCCSDGNQSVIYSWPFKDVEVIKSSCLQTWEAFQVSCELEMLDIKCMYCTVGPASK